MGSFANTVFRLLLGWVRAFVQDTWAMLSGSEQSGFLKWFTNHWVGLFLVLCIIGVIVDLVVYLIRWQPYRVWKSFLVRNRKKRRPMQENEPDEDQSIREFPTEQTAASVLSETEPPQQDVPETEKNIDKFSRAIQPGRRRRWVSEIFSEGNTEENTIPPDSLIDADEAYYQPVYPKNWKKNGDKSEE